MGEGTTSAKALRHHIGTQGRDGRAAGGWSGGHAAARLREESGLSAQDGKPLEDFVQRSDLLMFLKDHSEYWVESRQTEGQQQRDRFRGRRR